MPSQTPRRRSARRTAAANNEGGTAAQFVDGLLAALADLETLPSPGDRGLRVLHGVNSNGSSPRPFDSVLAEATDILVSSRRLFLYRGDVVMEQESDGGKRLTPLTFGGKVLPHAPSLLANIFSVSNN